MLAGIDAVVHLANIPAPDIHTPAITFNANMAMNFNVFLAAAQVRLERVVWASSETTLGLPFDDPPRYAPVDEDHYPVPTTTYALSKVASETVATHIAEWSGVPFIGLRFSNILGPADYEQFPSYWPDPRAAQVEPVGLHRRAGRGRGLPAGPGGARRGQRELHHRRGRHGDEPAVGGACSRRSSPACRLTRDVGEFGSLLATDRAREALGFVPQHSWRDHVAAPGILTGGAPGPGSGTAGARPAAAPPELT